MPAFASALGHIAVCLAGVSLVSAAAAQSSSTGAPGTVERGRYLVKIAGCNDCHTPGYPQAGGKIAEEKWLIGDSLGWRGEWGTTYPANLRRYVQDLSEEEWMKVARTKVMRPPMPWFILRDMTDQDLSSIYRYIRHLGPAGDPAPSYLPPGEEPRGPYVQFPMPPK